MKITMKKSLAVILSLVMCVSVLFGINLSAVAADNTVTYVKDGSYVYNWGERGTEATFLSPMAIEFYTENDVALSELLALSGSSTESGVPSSALYSTLHNLMEINHTNPTSYDGTRDLFKYTDCENSGSPSTISSFYSGTAIGPDWDGGSTWNREHTWPNSKGDLAGNGENDIMMLRPAATSENGSRSNKAYGTSTNTSYFYPNIGSYDLRGDVARIILYQYVRWECTNTGSSYNPTGIFGTNGVIESKEVLLDWVEADPVDTWELGRNDAVEAITGTRNVFVDYPELAFDLFNEAVPTGYTSPSGGTDVDGTTGSGSTGDTTTETGGNYYVKVTSNADLTDGDYLIVYENDGANGVALDGGLTTIDAAGNIIPVTIENSKIVADDTANAAKVTINVTAGTIKTASGLYIGHSGTKNTLGSSTSSDFTNTITIDENGNAVIDSSPDDEYVLMLNLNSGNNWFRFYMGTQKTIALYKLTEVESGGEGGETPDPEEPTPDPEPEDPTPDTPITGTETEVTINFGTTIQRDSLSTEKQVWSNEDLTFTNNKASSSNDIIDSSNPVRLYAHSSITLEHSNGIKAITFAADTATYAKNLNESISTSTGATVTTDGNNITVTFDTAVKSYTIADLTAQVRLDSVTAVVLVNTSAPTITVTAQANNDTYGTVEVSGKYITATPKSGYEIDSTNPYTIISGTVNTVTQSGNSFAITADTNVTIQINFVEREKAEVKYYQHGDLAFTESVAIGDNTTLPTHFGNVPLGWTFAGWTTTEISGETTTEPTVLASKSNYAINGDTTFYAVYYYSKTETVESTTQGGKAYEKVTSAPADWSGTYLIVYEDGKVAFDGSRTTLDGTSNTISVTIDNNKIESNATTDAATFTITKSSSNYLIQSNSGYYVGNTSNANALKSSKTDTYDNTLSINADGSVNIVSASSYLRYNATSGQYRFRYYKSSSYTGQKAIRLYKLVETAGDSTTTTVTTNYYFTNRAYTDSETQGYYVKVTEDLTDWSGDYLVVFEGTDKKASAVFDGSRPTLDEAHNILNGVSTNGGAIKAKQAIDAAKITIAKSGDKYVIEANGKYIAPTSGANGIAVGTENLHTITFADGNVDIIGSTGSYLRFNSDNGKNNYRFRYYQASSYQNQAAITLYKWIPLEAAITGAQVTVGADLSVNYYTNITGVENIDEYDLAMRFSIDDEVIDTVTGTVIDGQYVFDFAGLAPQRMADIIKAELLINGGAIDVKDNYSIKTNAQNLLTENAGNAELCQFITDMLYYGAAAQKYTKYNTDNLATDGVIGLGTPSTATPTETDKMSLETQEGVSSGSPYFRSATVWFDSKNGIIVKVEGVTANTWIEVHGEKVEIVDGQYKLSDIKVTDFDNMYTFELYEDGYLIQTLTYSINSYAYSKQNSTNANMAELALALFRLGQSAENL